MQSITFTCETITPMFLAGADGTTPELRAPSIKGALRFWWRAMNSNLPTKVSEKWVYDKLKQEEQNLFGGISKSALKSRVTVRVSPKKEIEYTISDLKKTVGEQFISKSKINYDKPGLAYIFFVYLTSQDHVDKKGFAKGTIFNITFQCDDEDITILLKVIANFWLFTYMGGLGTRARRGAGSFKISLLKSEQYSSKAILDLLQVSKLSMQPIVNQQISDFIKQNYKIVKKILQVSTSGNNCDEYSNLNDAPIFVNKKSFPNWEMAMNDFGIKMKNHRTSKSRHPNAEFTQETLDQKAAFGLPIKVRNVDHPFVTLNSSDRRASPLAFSIIEDAQKKYYWILTRLSGVFMADDDQIVFDTGKIPYWDVEDNTLIDSFIEIISDNAFKIQ